MAFVSSSVLMPARAEHLYELFRAVAQVLFKPGESSRFMIHLRHKGGLLVRVGNAGFGHGMAHRLLAGSVADRVLRRAHGSAGDHLAGALILQVPAEGGQPCVRRLGEYAQLWLDSRDITAGTRLNYKSVLNIYWMPHLALTRIDLITPTLLRRIVAGTEWTSSGVKRNAIVKLAAIMRSAVGDGLLQKNPAESMELPKRTKKEVDPFQLAEAERIIDRLYQTEHWPSLIYAALFEFLFFTGLRISEALALQWQDVGTVHIRRTVALGELEERTKTGSDRFVLLNQRALRALWFAKVYADRRLLGVGRVTSTPHVLPPSKGQVHVKQTSNVHHQWRPTLQVLGIRYRPPYNCRHTYATMCLTVRPQPRLYRSAARPLRANADLNIRALDQLNL